MQNKRVEQTYNYWKKWYHALPSAYNRELHHIFPGRIGIDKCCPILMILLTHQEHNDWRVIKRLRDITRDSRKKVEQNYDKYLGCSQAIFQLCPECPMCNKRTKGD